MSDQADQRPRHQLVLDRKRQQAMELLNQKQKRRSSLVGDNNRLALKARLVVSQAIGGPYPICPWCN